MSGRPAPEIPYRSKRTFRRQLKVSRKPRAVVPGRGAQEEQRRGATRQPARERSVGPRGLAFPAKRSAQRSVRESAWQ